MPATFRINRALGVVFSTFSGDLSDEHMLEHQRRLAKDPDFDPGLRQLVDMRGIQELTITTEGVQALAARSPFGSGSRRAVIAEQEVVFGMARMFEILRGPDGGELRVFRFEGDARDWLGLSDGDA